MPVTPTSRNLLLDPTGTHTRGRHTHTQTKIFKKMLKNLIKNGGYNLPESSKASYMGPLIILCHLWFVFCYFY